MVPHIPAALDESSAMAAQARLLDDCLRRYGVQEFILWYYTPMALEFRRHLSPQTTIYDCMDELSAFLEAPAALSRLERELFSRADVVIAARQKPVRGQAAPARRFVYSRAALIRRILDGRGHGPGCGAAARNSPPSSRLTSV